MDHTIRNPAGNPGLEALELRDANARDLTPTVQDAGAFPPDPELSPEEEAEMEAQYRARLASLPCTCAKINGQCDTDSMCPRHGRCSPQQTVRGSAPAGWREGACVACSAALHVAEETTGDVLCPQCERTGNALADDEDDDPDPTRPGAAALHPDYPLFAASVKRWPDDVLVTGIDMADRDRLCGFGNDDPARLAWIHAATNELLRRVDSMHRAAA